MPGYTHSYNQLKMSEKKEQQGQDMSPEKSEGEVPEITPEQLKVFKDFTKEYIKYYINFTISME